MMNGFGNIFRVTTFGESHGAAIGGIVEGCPAGIKFDNHLLQQELLRRRPGAALTSQRQETDEVEILSGVFEGFTTGTPIGFQIRNIDARSADYQPGIFRPGHADFTYFAKYHYMDYRGGGRASARETVARVVAGAIAKMALRQQNIDVAAYISQIGMVKTDETYSFESVKNCQLFPQVPNTQLSQRMAHEVELARAEGDSVGGTITCMVQGLPVGVGEPIYDKLSARLAYAVMSIPACKGFEYGDGFEASGKRGSQSNDSFVVENDHITTATNHCGGILGGISTGNTIVLRAAFKPTPTIGKVQQTVDKNRQSMETSIKGRHDSCVVLRALPVVEAMVAITLLDMLLLQKTNRL